MQFLAMTAPRHPEEQYLDLLRELVVKTERTETRQDRTGVGTTAVFGREMRFDLSLGFPVFSTKQVLYRSAWKEILWMLRGGTNIRELLVGAPRVGIWSEWPLKAWLEAQGRELPGDPDERAAAKADFEARIIEDEDFAARWGELGPVYGAQWRAWKAADGRRIDQVEATLDTLRHNPTSRRNIIEGWNVGEIEEMAKTGLPPCHKTYQFLVEDGRLSVICNQRSCDTFLGVPFNVANLALMVHLFAQQTGLEPGEAIWYGHDVHLYRNTVEQAREQLTREPRPLPTLRILTPRADLRDYTVNDFQLVGYAPHPPIKATVAV